MYQYFACMAYIAILGMIVRPSKGKRRRAVFLALSFVVLIALASVRSYTVGMDTMMYWTHYGYIGRAGVRAFETVRFEPGFTALCLLLYQISPSPQLLFFTTSVLIYVPVAYFIYRESDNPALSTFLFVALTIYTQYLCLMREGIAIALVLVATTFLTRGKKIPFILLIVLAMLFHRSAIACLALLFADRLGFKGKHIAVYIALFAAMFVYASAFSDFVASLLSKDRLYREKFMGSNYYGALIRTLFYGLLVFLSVNYIEVGKRRGVIPDDARVRVIEHALMLWLLFSVLGMRIQIWGRVSCLFQPFVLIAIPLALKVPPPKERFLMTALICLAAIAYFVIVGVFRPEWQGAIPYEVGFAGLQMLLGWP